ncbi:N-formylglutamate amidohydrolase [Xylophilus rhododendri]|uniref:N-formylglutamate amidohydrolase n=1 Tax=Xylophilus rhododendri TaxID=2697032 RepID=A0A857J4C2_9BURK|nr:N-formylglutamate amidohydrolase [Xylophilus rhododendri]QHI97718.1 N-formylglutamate amidohydrolase [Xylophilus rhododendri]
MAPTPHPSFTLLPPAAPPIALVCDSPHSGTRYPDDFRAAVPLALLRSAEDTHVDALWAGLAQQGATLISADFPRSYIDPNRKLEDIDPALLDAPWPGLARPSEKSRIGSGLIWRTVHLDTPIYDRRLGVAEVQNRIERCYKPYHQALASAIEQAHARFGAVWHLNLHSMPGNAYERLQMHDRGPLADFVLGDRDGSTCEPAFVELVRSTLAAMGYTVALNDPYKGVELLAQIGRPQLRRHSMQIEIRRPLYMDERTRERNSHFQALKGDLDRLIATIARYVRTQAVENADAR